MSSKKKQKRKGEAKLEAKVQKLERLAAKLEKQAKNAANGAAPNKDVPRPTMFGSQEPPPPLVGPLRAMVIMAHPDDADFTSAGTVAKWCAEGWDVTYVLVTGGDKGTHDLEMHPEKLAAIREQEQREACKVLGVKDLVCLGYPDGFTVDDHELRGQIVRLLRLYRPDVVVTWDAFRHSFNHRDHRTVGLVTSDAIYPLVRDRLFYPAHEEDGLESHQVNDVLLAGAAEPDYEVDITDYAERKVDAIMCHTSQIGGRTREEFLKNIESQDKPILEKFRRWSIRRPARPDDKKDEEAAGDENTEEEGDEQAVAAVAKAKGQH
ncbi:MAG: PIG-L deacetylase family protein [Dehalococcoidia bacterium]